MAAVTAPTRSPQATVGARVGRGPQRRKVGMTACAGLVPRRPWRCEPLDRSQIVAIPLAAGAFAWAGITLPPAVGAVLMSLSTIVVALNAQLLRRVQLTPSTQSRPATPTPSPA